MDSIYNLLENNTAKQNPDGFLARIWKGTASGLTMEKQEALF